MKVVAVRTDDHHSGLDARRGLARLLEGDGPIATVVVSRTPQGWTVRVDRPDRTAEYRGDDDTELLSDLLDALATAGIELAILTGPVPIDAPVLYVGTGTDEEAFASVDPAVFEAGDGAAIESAIANLEEHETLESMIRRATDHPEADRGGAVATFTGRVRADNLADHRTTHLEYEKYEDVADQELAAIRTELLKRDGVIEVLFHHNTGIVEAGEDAVYVVVLAGHREEAFDACRDGIDMLKDRVPIFKKEVTESGEYWAHDRP